jgi:hypothetical protein
MIPKNKFPLYKMKKIRTIKLIAWIIFFIASITAIPLFSFSQAPRVGTSLMSRFREYVHPYGPTGDVLPTGSLKAITTSLKPWIIYGDRDNVDSYQTPEAKLVIKKIKFMDPFWVTSVSNDGKYLQIVKCNDEIIDVATKKLNEKYDQSRDYYGWVPCTNMLLWEASLIDKDTKFIIKALTVHQPEALNNPSQYAEDHKVKLYTSPDLSSRSDNVIKLFNFYYIFKEDENSYLIGKDYEIDDPGDAPHVVLGWVPKKIIQLWKKRLCLETNYDKAAIAELSNDSVHPCIFRKKEEAINFENALSADQDNALKYYEIGQRFKSTNKRLPILEQDKNDSNLVQTAFITPIFNSKNETIESVEKHNEDEKNFNTQSHEARKINLVFLLGGSENVKSYYANLSEGIKSATEKMRGSSNSFRFGCVIYNNKKCNNDVIPLNLTSDVDELTRFISLNSGGANSCSSAKPEYCALLPGIQKACFLLAGHEKETNIFIIIGDAGSKSDEQKSLATEVTKQVANLKCGWLVYQVVNPGTDPFNNFVYQIKGISENANKSINDHFLSKSFGTLNPTFQKRSSGNNSWSVYEFDKNTCALYGRFEFATEKNLDPAVVSETIKRMVVAENENIDRLIDQMQDLVSGAGEKLKNISPAMAMFLKDMNYDLNDPKFLAQINGDNFQFCIKGWLSTRRTGIKNDLFSYIVFVTAQEYQLIKKLMDDIVSSANNDNTDLREKLTQVYTETLKQYLGGAESGKVIDNMKMDEVMAYVTGIHTHSELFKKYKIKDIKNKLTPADLTNLVELIRKKRDLLRKIEADTEYRRMDMDKRTYYWIPDDYLP